MTDPNLHIRKKVAGGATGTMVGALVGGPIGAVVGGMLGTFIGTAAENKGVQAGKSEPEKSSTGAKSKAKSSGVRRVPEGGRGGARPKKRTVRSGS